MPGSRHMSFFASSFYNLHEGQGSANPKYNADNAGHSSIAGIINNPNTK